eukprot:3178452-Pleurochrysis_carterae.AAC.1
MVEGASKAEKTGSGGRRTCSLQRQEMMHLDAFRLDKTRASAGPPTISPLRISKNPLECTPFTR